MIKKEESRQVKIAEDIAEFNFGANNLLELIVNNRNICLVKTTNGLQACAAKCPHAGAKMALGKLDNKGNIVCCVHNYHFNLQNGRDSLNEGYFLKLYSVIVNNEGVFVEL